jgi:hypothetical protein
MLLERISTQVSNSLTSQGIGFLIPRALGLRISRRRASSNLKLRTVCIERRLYALRERVALRIQQKIAARAHASLHGAIAEAESLKARYRSETRDGAARPNSGNRKHKVLAYEVFPAACSEALRAQPLRVRA